MKLTVPHRVQKLVFITSQSRCHLNVPNGPSHYFGLWTIPTHLSFIQKQKQKQIQQLWSCLSSPPLVFTMLSSAISGKQISPAVITSREVSHSIYLLLSSSSLLLGFWTQGRLPLSSACTEQKLWFRVMTCPYHESLQVDHFPIIYLTFWILTAKLLTCVFPYVSDPQQRSRASWTRRNGRSGSETAVSLEREECAMSWS